MKTCIDCIDRLTEIKGSIHRKIIFMSQNYTTISFITEINHCSVGNFIFMKLKQDQTDSKKDLINKFLKEAVSVIESIKFYFFIFSVHVKCKQIINI